jgi:ATP-dependent RNA helicase SUPV3L1/SUV3
MSILGCSPEELGNVLKALGFRLERRPVKVTPPAPSLLAGYASVADAAVGAAVTLAGGAPTLTATPEAPAAEAPAAPVDTAVVEGSATTAVPEPPMEEIWRPRRHKHERHERRGGEQRREPRDRSRSGRRAPPSSRP